MRKSIYAWSRSKEQPQKQSASMRSRTVFAAHDDTIWRAAKGKIDKGQNFRIVRDGIGKAGRDQHRPIAKIDYGCRTEF